MAKFYLQLENGGQFICNALNEHYAIARFWIFQQRKFARIDPASWPFLNISIFNIAMSYDIHQGRESEAQTVSAELAYWIFLGLGSKYQFALDYALIAAYGFDQYDQFSNAAFDAAEAAGIG